jgi:hypothetical protein
MLFVQGGLPTVPEVEPALEAISPVQEQQQQQQPIEPEVKVEATPVAAPFAVEPLPTAAAAPVLAPAAPFEAPVQQQWQPEIAVIKNAQMINPSSLVCNINLSPQKLSIPHRLFA